MIGKSIIGRSFSKLLKYILRSNALLNENTVQLLHMHRLENAAEEMADIATLAPGIQTPAWHLIMAWRSNEFPSGVERSHVQNRMHEAAHSLLRKLGLEDHQAIIVPHWDRKGGLIPGERHYEVHIAANRVSLDGVAVRSSFDFVRVERAVAEISAEMGFFLVPGRFNGVAPDPQNPKIAQPREARFAVSSSAKRVQDRSGEWSIAEEIHDDPARFARLQKARNAGWEALVAELTSQGYRLEYGAYQRRPGQVPGLVVVDIAKPTRRMAFSKLDTPHLKWGQGALERELGAISEGLVRQPGGAVADTPDAQPEPAQQPAKAPPRHRTDGHIWERFRQQQAEHKAGNRAARRKLVIANRSAYRNFDAHQRKLLKSLTSQQRWVARQSLQAFPLALVVAAVCHFVQIARFAALKRSYQRQCDRAYSDYFDARIPQLQWTEFKKTARREEQRAASEARRKRLENAAASDLQNASQRAASARIAMEAALATTNLAITAARWKREQASAAAIISKRMNERNASDGKSRGVPREHTLAQTRHRADAGDTGTDAARHAKSAIESRGQIEGAGDYTTADAAGRNVGSAREGTLGSEADVAPALQKPGPSADRAMLNMPPSVRSQDSAAHAGPEGGSSRNPIPGNPVHGKSDGASDGLHKRMLALPASTGRAALALAIGRAGCAPITGKSIAAEVESPPPVVPISATDDAAQPARQIEIEIASPVQAPPRSTPAPIRDMPPQVRSADLAHAMNTARPPAVEPAQVKTAATDNVIPAPAPALPLGPQRANLPVPTQPLAKPSTGPASSPSASLARQAAPPAGDSDAISAALAVEHKSLPALLKPSIAASRSSRDAPAPVRIARDAAHSSANPLVNPNAGAMGPINAESAGTVQAVRPPLPVAQPNPATAPLAAVAAKSVAGPNDGQAISTITPTAQKTAEMATANTNPQPSGAQSTDPIFDVFEAIRNDKTPDPDCHRVFGAVSIHLHKIAWVYISNYSQGIHTLSTEALEEHKSLEKHLGKLAGELFDLSKYPENVDCAWEYFGDLAVLPIDPEFLPAPKKIQRPAIRSLQRQQYDRGGR